MKWVFNSSVFKKAFSILFVLFTLNVYCFMTNPLSAALAPVESRNANSGASSGSNSGTTSQPISSPRVFSGTDRLAAGANSGSATRSSPETKSNPQAANSSSSVSTSAHANSNSNPNANPRSSYPMTAQDRAAHLTLSQIENLQREVSELRGLVETQEHTIKQLKKSQQDLYLDLERRLNQLQNSGSATVTATAKANTVATNSVSASNTSNKAQSATSNGSQLSGSQKVVKTTKTTAAKGVSTVANGASTDKISASDSSVSGNSLDKLDKSAKVSGDQEAYQQAYAFVRSKKYPEAISALQEYLVQYKNGVQAPQAHYWLGEVYMLQWQSDKNNQSLLEKAANEFNSITTEYPNHPKTADALLKLGLIEIDRGNPDSATQYLSLVKTRYPGSAAARVAENRLQQLAAD